MATARALSPGANYWEQFFSALSCGTPEEQSAWMESEVSRYMTTFGFTEENAWRTIACNLAFFSGYYDGGVVKAMRDRFGIFPECFDSEDYRQVKRQSLNDSGKPAADSPV